MLKTHVGFSSYLIETIASFATILPLETAPVLGSNEYTFLVIRDAADTEVVKVHTVGELLVMERAQDGTTAHNFPKGACVSFDMVPAVVKDILCNTSCCADDDCVLVTDTGTELPDGVLNTPYSATMVFSGTLPIKIAVSGVPSWLTAKVGPNYVTFSGTPISAQTVSVSAAATNCNGRGLVTAYTSFKIE